MTGDDRIRRQRRKNRRPAGGDAHIRARGGRSASSRWWLERHLNDPYVAAAERHGYRARAAFKLAEIDDKHAVLGPGARVLDLGAAPGSWCQVARERVGADGIVVGLDLLPIDPLPGVTFVQGDIHDPAVTEPLRTALGGAADVVLSDMSPNTTGHKPTDRLRIEAVVEAALDLAEDLLAPGGRFLAKMRHAGGDDAVTGRLKRRFRRVQRVKPPASRSDSDEVYVLATGYHGGA